MTDISTIRKRLNDETDPDERINLLNQAKKIWNSDEPSWVFLAIVIERLKDKNEIDDVKKAAINLLETMDKYIYLNDSKTDDLFEDLFSVLASQVEKFSKEHYSFIINLYIYIEKFIQILYNQDAEFNKHHLKKILDIITNKIMIFCKIPEKTIDIGIALYYLKMVQTILSTYSDWNTTQQHYRLPVSKIWGNVEENILYFLEIDSKDIRSLCASLMVLYSKTEGRLKLENIIKEEDESLVLSQLMNALVEVGTKESRFVLMRISQKGNQQDKENARKCLNELALKLGYKEGIEMINKLKPTESFTVRESLALVTSFLSTIGLFFTILSISDNFSNLNGLLITAVIFLALSILAIIIIPINHACKLRQYKVILQTWEIEGYY